MNKKSLIILIIIGIIVLVAIVLIYIEKTEPTERTKRTTEIAKVVEITLDKQEYETDSDLRLKIKNNLDKKICFSSCYPYYLDKKREQDWKGYSYPECETNNLAEICLNPGETKAFEFSLLSFSSKGTHRVSIPTCSECNIGQEFKQEKCFYSNEFFINDLII